MRGPRLFTKAVSTAEMTPLLRLAASLERRGQVSEARELLADGLEAAAKKGEPATLVRVALRHARATARLEGLAPAEQALAGFQRKLAKVLSSNPGALRALEIGRGELREWAGDLEGALQTWGYDEFAQHLPERVTGAPYRQSDPRPLAPATTDADLQAARTLIDLERFDAAEQLLGRVRGQGHIDEGILDIYRGTLERERGNYGRAEEHYLRAQRRMEQLGVPSRDGHQVACLHGLARLFMRTEDWERAEDLLLDAVLTGSEDGGDDNPYLVSLLPDLGETCHALDRSDEAIRATSRALELAERWGSGALESAYAEFAAAVTHQAVAPKQALVHLDTASRRLQALPSGHRRRVRLAELRAAIER